MRLKLTLSSTGSFGVSLGLKTVHFKTCTASQVSWYCKGRRAYLVSYSRTDGGFKAPVCIASARFLPSVRPMIPWLVYHDRGAGLSCRRDPLFSTCNRERGSRVFACYPGSLLARPRVTSSAQASQPYCITRTVWLTSRFLVHRGPYLWVFDDYRV